MRAFGCLLDDIFNLVPSCEENSQENSKKIPEKSVSVSETAPLQSVRESSTSNADREAQWRDGVVALRDLCFLFDVRARPCFSEIVGFLDKISVHVQ